MHKRDTSDYFVIIFICLAMAALMVLLIGFGFSLGREYAIPQPSTTPPAAAVSPSPTTDLDPNIVTPQEPDNAVSAPTDAPVDAAMPTAEPESMQRAIFRLTNTVRTERGLSELAYSYRLQDAADLRARECAESFSHTRPDGSSCHSVVEEYDYRVTGENLIMADEEIALPEVMMSKWMLSEGHRSNILLPQFTELAVGVYEKDGVVYAVQIFMG